MCAADVDDEADRTGLPRISAEGKHVESSEVESSIGDHVPREGPRVGGRVVGAAEPIGHLLHAAWTAICETVVVADAIEAGHGPTDSRVRHGAARGL